MEKSSGKKFKCALTSVYHPCHDDEHELFNDCLSSLLSKIATKTEVLVGKDVNARIGIWDRTEYKSVLGLHGIDGRNTQGTNLLQIYSSHRLRVENTFFAHNNYTTYVSMGDNHTLSMHDLFVASQTLHKRIRDQKVVNDGTDSDHSSVKLKLAITPIKFKGNAITRGVIDWGENHVRWKV